MSVFTDTACQAIKHYLKIAKRHYAPAIFSEKKEALTLDQLDPEDSAGLYCTAKHIIFDITQSGAGDVSNTQYAYSGIKRFAEHLEAFLSQYMIENNCVIHRAQKVAGFMISNLQVLSLPASKLTAALTRQVKNQQQFIVSHGTREQVDLYKNQINALAIDPETGSADLVDYLKSELFSIDSAA